MPITLDYLNDLHDRLVVSIRDALSLPSMQVYFEAQLPSLNQSNYPYAVIGIQDGSQREGIEGWIEYNRTVIIRVVVGHYHINHSGEQPEAAYTYLPKLEEKVRTGILTNSTYTTAPDYVAHDTVTILSDTGVRLFRSVGLNGEYHQIGFEMRLSVAIRRR